MTKGKTGAKHPLLLGMVIYAAIFLMASAVGLGVFWKFIDAYEVSRPEHVMDDYVSQLTAEAVADRSEELISRVDHDLQTEEECRQVILNALGDEITYARKSSECTDEQIVYVLRCGSRIIGRVTLKTSDTGDFGFVNWQISEESFDLSFLLSDRVSVTVPGDFTVAVNGKVLTDAYITADGIQYTALDDFYDDYALPVMVTYEAGPVLGSVEVETFSASGEPVVLSEDTDFNSFLYNCGKNDLQRLMKFADSFLARYVAFTGSAHKSSQRNYAKLLPYVVIGSDLHQRMSMALDGLGWAQSKGDVLISIVYNGFMDIGDGMYICDATYEVDTYGREGVVRTTNNVRFVIVENKGELRVEMLTSY